MSKTSSLEHPDLHTTYTGQKVEPRVLNFITGVSPEHNLGVNNADIHTLRTALLERMYFCSVSGAFVEPPQIKLNVIQPKLKEFTSKLVRNFHATPSTGEEVVDMYKGRKRTIYQQALEDHAVYGLRRRDAFINAFVKVEKVNVSKAPRCIQPRRPVYNLCMGRYIKKVEHRLYKRIARVFGDGPTVMKGYTVQGVARIIKGKWDSFVNPVAVGLDATKFDMHVCEGMLKWEHSIYKAIYKNDPYLAKMLRWQVDNRGFARCEDGTIRYKVKGRRASGDMNTALGNCLIMCALVWTYAQERGVDLKLVNNGDDCVVFMERESLPAFSRGLSEWFLEMGFRMVVEQPVFELEQIEFCQMHPVLGAGGYTMVRNIKVALIKDSLCTMALDNKAARKWMYAVGECGLALTSGVPIMQSFYSAYLRGGLPSKINLAPQMQTGLSMMRGDLVSRVGTVTPAARLAVYVAWGITPDEQVELEKYYGSWSFEDQADTETNSVEPIFNVL